MIREIVRSLSTLLFISSISSPAFCAEPTTSVSNPELGPYLHDMSTRLRRGWDGTGPRDVEHGPIVRFRVHKSGLLLDAYLWHHSGFKNLDQSFLQAVWNASPFRPLVGTSRPFMDFEVDFDFRDYKKFGKAKIIESYGPDGLPSKWTDEKSDVDICKFESEQLESVISELNKGQPEKAEEFCNQTCDPRCVETVLAFNIWHATKQCVAKKSDEKLRDLFQAIPPEWLKPGDATWETTKSHLIDYVHNLKSTDSTTNDPALDRTIGDALASIQSNVQERRISTVRF